ncbi:MAG: helical backbone metal receptor [Nitrospinota bacterium]
MNQFQNYNFLFLNLLKKTIPAFCLFLLLGFSSITKAEEASKAQRIISTSPSITETLFALGVGDRVVGVTDFCKYPPEACKISSIGGMVNPNMEVLVSLRPDLVLHLSHSVRMEENVRTLGIPSMKVNMNTLDDILESIQFLGKALGVKNNADKLRNKIINGIQFYKNKLQNVSAKETLLLLGDSSDPGRDLYATGRGTFLHELLEISGGKNIIPASLARYPRITKEFIIEKSPDVIIEAGPKSRLSPEQIKERMKGWKRFPTIKAVQSENVHYIGEDYILIPGPRLLKIIEKFSKAIHPEIFSNSSPSTLHGNESTP